MSVEVINIHTDMIPSQGVPGGTPFIDDLRNRWLPLRDGILLQSIPIKQPWIASAHTNCSLLGCAYLHECVNIFKVGAVQLDIPSDLCNIKHPITDALTVTYTLKQTTALEVHIQQAA